MENRARPLALLTLMSLVLVSAAVMNGGADSAPGPGSEAMAADPGPVFPCLGSREINDLVEPLGYPCPLPDLQIQKTSACAAGAPYPACKWQVPVGERSGGLYKEWWRTPPEELWGGRKLVTLLLSAIALFEKRYPKEEIYIGDLDAPDSLHLSHRGGVDADVYLLRLMEWIQVEGPRYVDNMAWRTPESREAARDRVRHLAQCFIACSLGKVQIFYNDPKVVKPVNAWASSTGYVSPFGLPLSYHNDTHHDHFHVRVEKE